MKEAILCRHIYVATDAQHVKLLYFETLMKLKLLWRGGHTSDFVNTTFFITVAKKWGQAPRS